MQLEAHAARMLPSLLLPLNFSSNSFLELYRPNFVDAMHHCFLLVMKRTVIVQVLGHHSDTLVATTFLWSSVVKLNTLETVSVTLPQSHAGETQGRLAARAREEM